MNSAFKFAVLPDLPVFGGLDWAANSRFRISFGEQVHLASHNLSLLPGGTHQLRITKARVGTQLQCRGARIGRHGQDALKALLALAGRVLHTGAQVQLQVITLGSKIHRQRTVTINACAGGAHQLLGCGFVVHEEDIQINSGAATVEHSKVSVLGTHSKIQQPVVDELNQFKPVAGTRIQALAQCRVRRCAAKAQGTLSKLVTTKRLHRFKASLSPAQQAKVALQEVATRDFAAHGELGVHQCVDIDAIEVFANECQSGVDTQVLEQLSTMNCVERGLSCMVQFLLHADR